MYTIVLRHRNNKNGKKAVMVRIHNKIKNGIKKPLDTSITLPLPPCYPEQWDKLNSRYLNVVNDSSLFNAQLEKYEKICERVKYQIMMFQLDYNAKDFIALFKKYEKGLKY